MKPNWFIGLPVPAQSWLPEVLATLPECCRAFVPADLHMTVSFLGGIEPERGRALIPLLGEVRAAPFSITLGKLLALPKPTRPSALSFSIEGGHDQASAIIAVWRDQFLKLVEARPDPRPPLPHITVARPIRKYGAMGHARALAWSRAVTPPEVTLEINRIALYTWAEDRRRAQFQIVAEHTLS